MSTYPRTYDFIHADSIFSLYKDRYIISKLYIFVHFYLLPLYDNNKARYTLIRESSVLIRLFIRFTIS